MLVCRRDHVDADHFRMEEYRIAGILLAIGVVLWFVTVQVTRRTGGQPASFDPQNLSGERPAGPKN